MSSKPDTHADLEIAENDQALLPVPHSGEGLTLFGTADPKLVIERASTLATALADVIEQRRLFKVINQRKHVYVEGWTLLGSMLGVFPICEWTRELKDDNGRSLGWEAHVVAKTKDGQEVGAADAECRFAESKWKGRDSYAVRSMAQTRATSKALRLPLGFVMQLAGFDATPSEEMDGIVVEAPSADPSAVETKHDELVTELAEQMKRLKDVKGWSKAEVAESARRSFHLAKLDRFGDLNNVQLQSIIDAAKEVWPDAENTG